MFNVHRSLSVNQCILLDITEVLLCHVFSDTSSPPLADSSVVSAKWRSSFRKRTSGTINIKRRTKGSCAKGSTITCNHMDGRQAAAHVCNMWRGWFNVRKHKQTKDGQTWVSFFRATKDQDSLKKMKRCQVNYQVTISTINHCIPDQRPLYWLQDTNPAAIRKGHAQTLSTSAQFNGSKT